MKIAALIMAHRNPEQLYFLLGRLNSPLWKAYVHLDAKSERDNFRKCEAISNFISQRVGVNWGGYSQVQATINLLRSALEDPECTHFYLMTGQCFPLKSDEAIAQAIIAAGGQGDFISADRVGEASSPIPLWRLEYFAFNDHFSKKIARLIRGARLITPKRGSVSKLLRGLIPYAGSAYWLICRQTAEKILEFIDANPWFVAVFKFSHCPDESFFHTIVKHLGVAISAGSPTAVFWDGRPNPLTIDVERLREARSSWHFIARKFDFEVHPETKSELASRHSPDSCCVDFH